MFGFKIISQYEKGIVFRFGRALPGTREPGLTWINPVTDRLRKVNMQITVESVPGQDAITCDNVTLRVDAVIYYKVIDPLKAIINVQNYPYAVSQVAQTSLRSVIGQSSMDQLLSERATISARIKDVIDAPTEQPWGIRVERIEVKDVSLPESMKRSMSRQAEAERERRARIITADGEYQASRKLAQAASVMAADPAALQLRLLQTLAEVAAEKNRTIVMPIPVELLRYFDHAAPASTRSRAPSRPDPRHRRPGGARRVRDTRPHHARNPARQRCPDHASEPGPENARRRLTRGCPMTAELPGCLLAGAAGFEPATLLRVKCRRGIDRA